jgi:diaminopimelate epimerase
MTAHRFTKMHGLGNDFVVLDARAAPITMTDARARAIADRRTGVGCDQLITLESSETADLFMRIRNHDGGEVEACGNAARCVARLEMEEKEADTVLIDTNSGVVVAHDAGGGLVAVDMGEARLGWRDIPVAEECDTLHLDLAHGPLSDPVGVNIGNPHAIFFVEDAEAVDLAGLGPLLEVDALFPERANISVAEITGVDEIRLRVWERGVGLTRACGTGACATGVAANRRGLTGRATSVTLDGGALEIVWQDDGHVLMTGPAATAFHGEIDIKGLA